MHIADQVALNRGRVLGPGHARSHASDPTTQHVLIVVEVGQPLVAEGVGELVRHPISADRHEIAGVVGEQGQPGGEVPLVDQPGLDVVKLLHLVLEDQRGQVFVGGRGECGGHCRTPSRAFAASSNSVHVSQVSISAHRR